MNASAPSQRRSRWIVAPLVLVILLAIAWSAGWFYAASRAETLVTAWMEREAREGRTYACDDRAIGGFPFRIEVRCTGVTAQLQEAAGSAVLKARELVAVAQIYQPDLIIAEVTGPMTVAIPSEGVEYLAEWRLLQASLRGRPSDLRRLSIVADDPAIRLASAPDGTPIARASRLEAHVRRNAASAPGNVVFDLAGRTADASVALIPALAERPFRAEATGILRGVRDLSARQNVKRRLRDWQENGGRLELTGTRLQQGDALATATGEIGLSSQGRLEGRLNLTMAGLEHAIQALLGAEKAGRGSASILTGLTLLGRAELEGRRAVAVPLIFRDGRVYLGPVPVAQTTPLF